MYSRRKKKLQSDFFPFPLLQQVLADEAARSDVSEEADEHRDEEGSVEEGIGSATAESKEATEERIETSEEKVEDKSERDEDEQSDRVETAESAESSTAQEGKKQQDR